MLTNLGTLLDRLQGLVSKAFLLGGFIPMIFLVLINWGLLYYFYRPVYNSWSTFVLPPGDGQALYWVKLVLVLFVGALVIWNLNPMLRQFWEGKYLPEGISKPLRLINEKQFEALTLNRKDLVTSLQVFRTMQPSFRADLKAARGDDSKKPADPPDPKLDLAYENFRKKCEALELPTGQEAEDLFQLLKKDLQNKKATGTKLNLYQTGFVEMFNTILERMETQYSLFLTDISQRFPSDRSYIAPTVMGNLSRIHREFCLQQFGMDIEFFWIRLLKIVRADADFYPMLEESKTTLDFSVSIASALLLTTFLWIPLSLFAEGYWPFVLVALSGPLLIAIAYGIMVQSYRGFTEVVRSAVDTGRFKLLKELHAPYPANRKEEKELWKKLAAGDPDFTYEPEEKETKTTT